MATGNATAVEKDGYIRSLTTLRFFAVMLIVVHHLRAPFIPSLLTNENFGTLGVIFFLVLSGFVMRLNYTTFDRPADSLYFLWNRLLRIYPLHIVTFFACLIIFLSKGIPIDYTTALMNVMLLQSFFPAREVYFSFNSVSWILSTLLFFYGVFALVNHRPRLFPIVLAASLLSLAASLAIIETSPRGNDLWFRLWLLYLFPPNRLSIILLGVGTASFFIRQSGPFADGRGSLFFTVLEFLALVLIADFIVWNHLAQVMDAFLQSIPLSLRKSRLFLNLYYLSAPLTVLFAITVFSRERGMFTRLLQARPLVFLGNISYSIFISHQLLINYALSPYKALLYKTMEQPAVLVAVVLTIMLVSWALYAWVEHPLRTRLRFARH